MLALFFTAVAFAVAPYAAADVPSPRDNGSWVADLSGVLEPEQEAAIDARVDALKAELGAEIAVVTVPRVEGTPKEFTTALFNLWGIGDAQANNGVLVVMVTEDRRLEIEPGYGVEGVLADGWLGRMMDQHMVPAFRAGNLGGGLVAGVDALDTRLRAYPEETRLGTGGQVFLDREQRERQAAELRQAAAVGAAGVGGVSVFVGGAVLLGRRRRQCPVCRQQMVELSEEADDAHLDAGQRKEEQLGSVDYRVLVCEEHEQVRILPRGQWFSGFVQCRSCGYKTSTRKSNTLVQATYSHGGQVEVIENCAHCGRNHRSTYSTPRLQRTTTSSGGGYRSSGGGSSRSGGGGSFGGGRSGGGGAGRSW